MTVTTSTAVLRIQIVSDLHLDVHANHQTLPQFADSWEHPDADLIAVAGDVGNGIESIQRLRSLFPKKPIVMVSGNHDMYGMWWHNGIDLLREEARKHDIVLLENESWTFAGVQFHGCTLWTDFECHGIDQKKHLMKMGPKVVADYRRIGVVDGARNRKSVRHSFREMEFLMLIDESFVPNKGIRSLTVEDVIKKHRESRAWLRSRLERPAKTPCVVLTHHLPHALSLHPNYKNSVSNGAFMSHCDELFELPGSPDFWIHGHTHHRFQAVVGKTHLSCNPMGYPLKEGGMENPEFDRHLVIEVPVLQFPERPNNG